MSLNLIAVHKPFGSKRVIGNLNLSIPEGEVFGFLGPNGAGKTTTMRMILDIIKPDQGSVIWRGNKVRLETTRTFGYLPEERGLYPKMMVHDHPWIVGLSYVPFFTPMVLFARIVLTSIPTSYILLGILDLVISTILFIWIGGKLYRVCILLNGKISWLQIIRLIRQR